MAIEALGTPLALRVWSQTASIFCCRADGREPLSWATPDGAKTPIAIRIAAILATTSVRRQKIDRRNMLPDSKRSNPKINAKLPRAYSAGSVQFSILSRGTRPNSRVLLVTSVSPRKRACAAINRSFAPIMVPCSLRSARIWA